MTAAHFPGLTFGRVLPAKAAATGRRSEASSGVC